MANPTSNFGWQMPTNTDLVKDLPADFEVFGQAVDTSLMDLKGGTTGQVLSKASNTDMDFTWVTSDDANAIQNTIVDAKGDLISATGNDVPARLAVGNNGESLVADSSATTGLRWQATYAAGKNRIINGAMLIDQRNSGASLTINAAAASYSVDRWKGIGQATDGVFTLQQDSSAPAGFSKSLKATVTTADASIGTTQTYNIFQSIEGQNIIDFDFGVATAKTVTLSFWVRSSLTGTFGGGIRNSAADRSYPFSYSISAADTWEKKTVVITGDTTGTWPKDTGVGMNVNFSLGAGTDRTETAGSWYASNRSGVTGQTQVIGTLNATWYVTGVQIEIGNVPTAFTNAGGTFAGELAACQRYYYRNSNGASTGVFATGGVAFSTTQGIIPILTPVPMRITPTTLDTTGTASNYRLYNGSINLALSATPTIGAGDSNPNLVTLNVTVASGLSAGTIFQLSANSSSTAYIGLGAEL